MPYGRILYDTAVYTTPDGDRMSGVKGEVVEMDDASLARLTDESIFSPPAAEKATKSDFEKAAAPADEASADGGPPGLAGPHVARAAAEKSSSKSAPADQTPTA